MRIKQLAELTGITVRTVRHYHSVGLLAIPSQRDGWRDYTLEHVARVGRIRWLASAGLSLAAIGDLLESGPQNVVDDLQGTLEQVDRQLEELAEQRRRLVALLGAAMQGQALSPIPEVVAAHYRVMEESAADDRTVRAIRAERDFVELAWYRGEMPPMAELLFSPMDAAGTAQALAGYGRDLDSLDDTDMGDAAAAVVAHMIAAMGEHADTAARTITASEVDRVYDLLTATASSGQRRLGEAVRLRLHEVISERKTP